MVNNSNARPVVVVTGGAQGIGRRLAELSVEKGWRVAVLDIQPDPDSASPKSDLIYLQVDITQEAQVKGALESIHTHFGRIDALVNAAALFTAL